MPERRGELRVIDREADNVDAHRCPELLQLFDCSSGIQRRMDWLPVVIGSLF
jgi:hypothetical protein